MYHSAQIKEVLKELRTGMEGLTETEAAERLKKYGFNELPAKRKKSLVIRFLAQFWNAFALILFIAAVLAFLFGETIDTWVILGILLFNALLGFIQEYKAERAISALSALVVPQATVVRGGNLFKIKARELVPGDLIHIEEGDRIPADARLIRANNFRTDESSLTGESTPVQKNTDTLPHEFAISDRTNMVFMGTLSVGGSGRAIITETGRKTALGEIAGKVAEIEPKPTHYEKSTRKLAWRMGGLAILGTLLIFTVGFFVRDFPIAEISLFSIAALVSGIPEGLPAVLIIVLAIGVYRMARCNAVIHHLPSTETLAVTTVIATDKTGTLTQNAMTVKKIVSGFGKIWQASGTGWDPIGKFTENGKEIRPQENPALRELLQAAVLSSAAKISREDGKFSLIGDPTEAALVVLGEKAGYTQSSLEAECPLIAELPFSSDYKYRARLFLRNGAKEIVIAGAFEQILKLADFYIDEDGKDAKLDEEKRKRMLETSAEFAGSALRVLGIGKKQVPELQTELDHVDISGITILGIVGMIDPPREGAAEAVKSARRAGIRVIMKTGDHKNTAIAIAKDIGLVDSGETSVYTEAEINVMNEEQFQEAVRKAAIFARVTPNTKHRITQALQSQGAVVAVTGDGVNDAPALRQADIGISMGKTGTDVAREASEMVLVDDNFATIVGAIEEARTVFRNVRNASTFIVTTNVAEIITLILTILLGLPLPLIAIQILWLNIVSESFISVAIAAEPKQKDVLLLPPRPKNEPVLSHEAIPFVILMGVLMAGGAIPFFKSALPEGIEYARAAVFSWMAWTQIWNVWNMRALKKSVFSLGIISNKYVLGSMLLSGILAVLVIQTPKLQEIFGFAPLRLFDWIMIIGLSSAVLWTGEIYKLLDGFLTARRSTAKV